MAYNNLSGTVFLPDRLTTRLTLASGSIISGNLDFSDGANVVNIPRVQNATNNAILTNIGGDANTLTCESNLTFDGTTLNITGDMSASLGISASFLYGDGRYLTNVSGGGNAAGQGPEGSLQFKTEGAGAISGSSNLVFSNNVFRIGGGLKYNRTTTNTSMTASTTDYYIGTNTTNGPLAITLPAAGAMENGQTYVVKDEAGSAQSNNVLINASGSETIDGQNSIVLESPYASVQLYCNGTDKYYVC